MPLVVLRSHKSYAVVLGIFGLLALWVAAVLVWFAVFPSTQGLVLALPPGTIVTNVLGLLGPIIATLGFIFGLLLVGFRTKGASLMAVGAVVAVPFDLVGGLVVGTVLVLLSALMLVL